MQLPPLDITDVSLLLAIGAIILIITALLTSVHYGPTDFRIDKNKLQNAAIAAGSLFLATMILRIVGIILNT